MSRRALGENGQWLTQTVHHSPDPAGATHRRPLRSADAGASDPDGLLFPIITLYDPSTPRKEVSAVSAQKSLVNKYLQTCGDKWEPLVPSLHGTRVDYSRTKGLDLFTISKALGHSSIKVTENYLKGFDQEALDEKLEAMFS